MVALNGINEKEAVERRDLTISVCDHTDEQWKRKRKEVGVLVCVAIMKLINDARSVSSKGKDNLLDARLII